MTHHSPLRPFRQLVTLLLLPFYAVFWWVQKRRCLSNGGHEWENDWGGNTPRRGTVIVEYDYCKHCPAGRSRQPELEDNTARGKTDG